MDASAPSSTSAVHNLAQVKLSSLLCFMLTLGTKFIPDARMSSCSSADVHTAVTRYMWLLYCRCRFGSFSGCPRAVLVQNLARVKLSRIQALLLSLGAKFIPDSSLSAGSATKRLRYTASFAKFCLIHQDVCASKVASQLASSRAPTILCFRRLADQPVAFAIPSLSKCVQC